MVSLVRRRLVALPFLLLTVSAIVFGLVILIPGDPAAVIAGQGASKQQVDDIRRSLGLDQPVPERFWKWLVGVVHGDLGKSVISGEPVRTAISNHLPPTISLLGLSIVFAAVVGVALGLFSVWGGRVADRAVTVLTSLGNALPNYWLALLLLVMFAIGGLRNLPATGYVSIGSDPYQWYRHLLLPAIALAARPAAEIARHVRSAMVGVLSDDYIRTAVAKGLPTRTIMVKHALRNALIPAVTVLGWQIPSLLGGTVVIEQIFSIPGLGQLIWTAVFQRDVPVVQGVVLVAVLVTMATNLATDLLCTRLDPKLRRA